MEDSQPAVNISGGCLAPECTGVLESLEVKPPRPTPLRDRGDTEDLGEVIHPQLLGNEHWF